MAHHNFAHEPIKVAHSDSKPTHRRPIKKVQAPNGKKVLNQFSEIGPFMSKATFRLIELVQHNSDNLWPMYPASQIRAYLIYLNVNKAKTCFVRFADR